MKELNLAQIIKGNFCYLIGVTATRAIYKIDVDNEENGVIVTYMFDIPLNDIGTATLNVRERAGLLMRWIRKAIENKEFILCSQTKALKDKIDG